MFEKQSGGKKPGIVRKNATELNKYEMTPYYRTRDFKKQIAQLYVPVLTSHIEEANGRFPVFKIGKGVIEALLQKPGSSSSAHRRKLKQSANNNY